jgi:DNA-directed RNA polymerase specialized sigma24 family protein
MPSLLPVLVHDPDLPAMARAALHAAQASPDGLCQEAAKRRAAVTLSGLYGLTDPEIADLLGLPHNTPFRAPLASPHPC